LLVPTLKSLEATGDSGTRFDDVVTKILAGFSQRFASRFVVIDDQP